MPTKKCRFGFSCAAMMLTPGLTAENCPNRGTCGVLHELSPDEEVELVRAREIERLEWEAGREERLVEWTHEIERIRINQREAAILMLRSRGCPQSAESLGVTGALESLSERLEQLRSRLTGLDEAYIAPIGCEAHQYNVKRPSGTYEYNKLTAATPIFEPSERSEKVRVIHLSHDGDGRNLIGREGIDKRNKLLRLASQLKQMETALAGVLADLGN